MVSGRFLDDEEIKSVRRTNGLVSSTPCYRLQGQAAKTMAKA